MTIPYDSPRTIATLHKELMAADPHCGLTASALRRAVRCGQIRSVRIGAKYLITHKAVAEYISGTNRLNTSREDVPGICQLER